MKRLIILDPFLRQQAGHYAEYDFSLRDAARAQNIDVTIYGHKDWQGEGAIPHFGAASAHSAGHAMLASLPPVLRKLLFAPARLIYRAFVRPKNLFVEELETLDLPDDAILLCPSASYRDAAACLTRWPQKQWRFVLRQKPQTKAGWKCLERMPVSNALMTDTQDLADWLKAHAVYARVIPIPMTVPDFVGDVARHPMFTFALLGPARVEKGIALMPDLVKALKGRARFVIQTTLVKGQAPEPETEEAIAALKKLEGDDVVLIDDELSNEDFYRHLCEASCVLLPYDRARYKERSSGLLVQAYLCGRPAIVPADTWMASQVPAFLKHTVWQGDLLETCKAVLTRHEDMKDFTASWRAAHTPAKTLDSIWGGRR